MKKHIQKFLTFLLVVATLLAQTNLPINAESTTVEEETSINNIESEETLENEVEEEIIVSEDISEEEYSGPLARSTRQVKSTHSNVFNFSFKIKMLDVDGNPVSGAKVVSQQGWVTTSVENKAAGTSTITPSNSTASTYTTNSNGEVSFNVSQTMTESKTVTDLASGSRITPTVTYANAFINVYDPNQTKTSVCYIVRESTSSLSATPRANAGTLITPSYVVSSSATASTNFSPGSAKSLGSIINISKNGSEMSTTGTVASTGNFGFSQLNRFTHYYASPTYIYGTIYGGGTLNGSVSYTLQEAKIFNVTQNYYDQFGNQIQPSTTHEVCETAAYTSSYVKDMTISGTNYAYQGTVIDDTYENTGIYETPYQTHATNGDRYRITGVEEDHVVNHYYETTDTNLTVKHLEENTGATLSPDESHVYVTAANLTYGTSPVSVAGYAPTRVTLDGVDVLDASSGAITGYTVNSVLGPMEVVYYYDTDNYDTSTNPPTPGPDGIPDYEITISYEDDLGTTFVTPATYTDVVDYGASYSGASFLTTPETIVGYTQSGYYIDSGAYVTGLPTSPVLASVKSNHAIRLVYSQNYHVTYHGNGADSGNVPTDATNYLAGDSATVLGNVGTPALARNGYTFNDWNTQANGSGTDYVAGATMTISNHADLHAQWTPNNQTIVWNFNNGDTNQTDPTHTDATIILPTQPTRAGYTFAGWYTDNGTFLNAIPTTVPAAATGTVNNYYAKWTATAPVLTDATTGVLNVTLGGAVNLEAGLSWTDIDEALAPVNYGATYNSATYTTIITDMSTNTTVASIPTGSKGIYKVTYKVTDSTGLDSNVITRTVSVGYTVVGTVAWFAGNDFNIQLNQVNDTNIRTASGIEAWDISDPTNPVQVPTASIAVAHTITAIGNGQPVQFSALSQTYNVNANVFDIYNPTTKEGLNANDFAVPVSNANNAGYKAASGVVGFDASNPSVLVPLPASAINVDSTYTYPTVATPAHAVKFVTTNGTEITVQGTVFATNITLTANDIILSVATAQASSEADLLTRSGAAATTANLGATLNPLTISAADVAKITSKVAGSATPETITINASDDSGDTTTTTIKVYVFDTIGTNVAWIGNDFNIALANVTAQNLKNGAAVEAWDITGAVPTQIPNADINVISALPTAVGNGQAVTFEETHYNEQYGVNANVFDVYNPSTKEGINATDFTVPVMSANNMGYKTASGVAAWDASNPSAPVAVPSADVNVDSTYIYPTAAMPAHNVDFVTTNGTRITVQATVIATNITLTANDIAVSLAQAQVINDLTIIANSGATATTANLGAVTTVSIQASEVAKLTSLTAANPSGITIQIDATDTAGDSTSTTITVYVYDAIVGNVAWIGNDFNIQLTDVNDTNIKAASGVAAWDITNPAAPVAVPSASITVGHTITAIGNGQLVIFTALAQNYGVNANVFDSYNPSTKEGLNAHDFTVPVAAANNTGYKTASGIVGFDVSNASAPVAIPLTDINVDTAYVYPTVATPAHPVKFVTTNGTDITVQGTVIATNITLTANDIAITLTQAQAMTDAQILTLSSAAATTANLGATTTMTIMPTEVGKLTSLTAARPNGVTVRINATDTAGDSTSTTITVYVYDAIIGNVAWIGNDFNIQLTDVTDANIKTASGVEAWDITNQASPIAVASSSITVGHTITAVGNGQPVTFTALAQNYGVNANVFDSYDPGTQEGLNANDFTVAVAQANNSGYKVASSIVGWNVANASAPVLIPATDINVDETSYMGVGIYPTTATAAHSVPFMTNTGTSITVQGTVINSNITINANDIIMSVADAQASSETDLLTRSGATATTTNLGATMNPLSISATDVAKITSKTAGSAAPETITINASDDSGDANMRTINVYVYDTIGTNVAWNGNDFSIALGNVTAQALKDNANIEAWDITGGTPVQIPNADIQVITALPTTTGNGQLVTFEETHYNEQHSVQANVFDSYNPSTKEGLNANNFTVPVFQANNAGYKNASNVSGWDVTNQSAPVALPISDINVDSTYIYPTVATPAHPVKFVTNNGSQITVQGTVIASNIAITASDFAIDLATAQAITDGTILTNAGAVATTTNLGAMTNLTISAAEVAKLTSLNAAAPTGVAIQIDATDTAGDSTSTTINVYVYDAIVGNVGWTGNDFNIQLNAVNDANIKIASAVGAWDITNPAAPIIIPPASINVTHTIVAVGNGQAITFDTLGQHYGVLANVFDHYNPTTKEGLNANNFTVPVFLATNSGYKAASGVHGFDASNPAAPVAIPVADINVDSSYNYPTSATPAHPVKFVTNNGTDITVQGTVVVSNINLTANDFGILLSDAQTITDAQIITAAGALATTSNLGAVATITVDPAEVAKLTSLTTSGDVNIRIDATDTAGDSTSTMIKVVVLDDIDPLTNKGIRAYDFAAKVADVQTEANIITKGRVQVIDMITLADITTSEVINSNPTALPTGLNQAVQYTVAGTTLLATVNANIYDDYDVIKDLGIIAHDFAAKVADVQTEADIIVKGQVAVYEGVTGVDVTTAQTINSNPTSMSVGLGQTVQYTVVGTTLNIAVNANIYDDYDAITDLGMMATGFNAKVTDVQTEADIIARGQVAVYQGTTGIDVTAFQIINSNPTTLAAGLNQTVTYTAVGTTLSVPVIANIFTDLDPTTQTAMTANNFNAELQEVQTEAGVIAKGNVKVYDITGVITEITASQTIHANPTSLPIGLGQTVNYTVAGTSLSTTVTANVFDVYNPSTKEGINATGFTVELSDVPTANFIALAQVVAYDVSNPLTPVDITAGVVMTTSLPTTVGVHATGFATAGNGVSIVVPALVWEHIAPVETAELALKAHGFTVALTDVATLTMADVMTKANPSAINKQTGVDITSAITVDATEFAALQNVTVKGAYPLTFSITDAGQTISQTVYVLVYGETPAPTPNALGISAEDFTIRLADASVMTDQDALAKSAVFAVDMVTGADLSANITVDLTELANIQNTVVIGQYPLTFTITDGVSTLSQTIQVNVVENLDYVVLADDISIDIEDFKQHRINGTLEEHVVTTSNAKALETTTNTEIYDVVADCTMLHGIEVEVGQTYPVDIHFDATTSSIMSINADDAIMEENAPTHTATIQVTITETAEPVIPGLPITGEDGIIVLLIGLATFLISLAILLYLRKRSIEQYNR